MPFFKVTHNNCPEVVVEAASRREAVKAGLQQLGVPPDTTHPVRAWEVPAPVEATPVEAAPPLEQPPETS